MSIPQASKRPIVRYKKKMLIKRAKRNKERKREVIRKYGESGLRQCGKKMRYDTRDIASDIALKRSIESGIELRVYKCPICNGWHITHKERINLDAERHTRECTRVGEEAHAD